MASGSLSLAELDSLVGPEADVFDTLFGGRPASQQRKAPPQPGRTTPATAAAMSPSLGLSGQDQQRLLAGERATPAGSSATPAAGRRSRRATTASSAASVSSAAAPAGAQQSAVAAAGEHTTGRVSTPTHGEELTVRSSPSRPLSPSRPMSTVESAFSEPPMMEAVDDMEPVSVAQVHRRPSAAASVGEPSLTGKDSFVLPWDETDDGGGGGQRHLEGTVRPHPKHSVAAAEAAAKPTLEDEARRLEGELAAIEPELSQQESRTRAAKFELDTAEAELRVRMEERQAALRKEQSLVEPRLAESREFQRRKTEELRLETGVKIAGLRGTFAESERRRNDAIAQSMKDEHRAVLKEIEQTLVIRELLKRGVSPTKAAECVRQRQKQRPDEPLSADDVSDAIAEMALSREGIVVSVEDEMDLQAKLDVGRRVVHSFVLKARDAATSKISEMIRREVNAAVADIWKTRASENFSANAARREKLQELQRMSAVALKSARERCAEMRAASTEAWRERIGATEAKLKVTAAANLERQMGEFCAFRDKLLEQSRAQTAEAIARLEERHNAVSTTDSQVSEMSYRDAVGRCISQLKLHRKLWSDEHSSLTRTLQKESEVKAHHGLLTAQRIFSTQEDVAQNASVLMQKISTLQRDIATMSRECDRSVAIAAVDSPAGETHRNINDKKSAVASLSSIVTEHSDKVAAQRERMLIQLAEVETFLSRVTAECHDGMLQVRSEVAKVERVKALWEKELRMILSRTATDEPASCAGHVDPVSSSQRPPGRVLFAGEEAMLSVAHDIQTRLTEFSTRTQGQRKAVEELGLRIRNSDEELTQKSATVDNMMEKLFAGTLKLPDILHEVHKKELRLMSESSKLDAERTILDRDKSAFTESAARLQAAANRLREESSEVTAEHDSKKGMLLSMQRTQRELESQQHDIIQRHCEVQRARDDVSKEQSRVDAAQARWFEANARAHRFSHAFGVELSAAKLALKGAAPAAMTTTTTENTSSGTKIGSESRPRSALEEVSTSQYNADASCR